jgi:RNA polymerase sigma-70 factor, ECF subfamily
LNRIRISLRLFPISLERGVPILLALRALHFFRYAVTFSPCLDSIGVRNHAKSGCKEFNPFGMDDDCAAPPVPVTFASLPGMLDMDKRSTTFHTLYVQYAQDVYRFAHWLTGNSQDAMDITSETFVRAWTASNEPQMDTVKAYLFTIARNLHRKQWRRASRLEELDEAMPDPACSPDEAAIHRDEFQHALDAIRALPEIDRTALLLRAEEGMSYEEISAVTGLSITAAKVKVFRARAKLAAFLKTKTGETT